MSFKTIVVLVTSAVSGSDKYGNDVTSLTEVSIPECVVWPAGSPAELVQGQDIVTDTLICLFPAGTVVPVTARAKVFGRTYDVTGNTFDWTSPLTGHAPGVQATLKAVTG